MKVQHVFPISLIHPVSVFIFLYIGLQLYPATALPPAFIYTSTSYSSNNNCVYEGFYSEFCLPTFRVELDTPLRGFKQSNNVFINYHPPDVGKTFASHLSRTLISRGMRIGTIETASVHIAVFSKNYAKSCGCLNEIGIMLKTGAPIITVFYGVKPLDLACHVMYAPVLQLFRWTPVNNGAVYCKDLRVLEEEKTFDPETCEERPRYDSNTITEWRKALFDASLICGFERAVFGDEGRLVHDLVEDVLRINQVSSIEERQTSIPYDVFINHRGTDVKNTLASHLYYRLQSNGLRVFFDKEEAQKGHTVNSEVENAIKVASVHIAIFSRRYAESEWCMDELLLMVKSQSVIIPVFYDVKPSDIMLLNSVDEMNGVYAKALHILGNEKTFDPQTHEAKPRYDSETIEIWKGVLMEVTKRDGFQLETYDGDEGELVDNVVLEVDKQVKQKQRQLRTGKLCRKSN